MHLNIKRVLILAFSALAIMAQPKTVVVPWGESVPQKYAMSPNGMLWASVGNHIYIQQQQPPDKYIDGGTLAPQGWYDRVFVNGIPRLTNFSPGPDEKVTMAQIKIAGNSFPPNFWSVTTDVSASGVKIICDVPSYTFDGVAGTGKTIGDLVGPWSQPNGNYLMAGIISEPIGTNTTVYAGTKGSCRLTKLFTLPFKVTQVWKLGASYFIERVLDDSNQVNVITDVIRVDGTTVTTLASSNASAKPVFQAKEKAPCTMAVDGFSETAVWGCVGADGIGRAFFWKAGQVSEQYNSSVDQLLSQYVKAVYISKDKIFLAGGALGNSIQYLVAKNATSGKKTLVAKVGDTFDGFKPTTFPTAFAVISGTGKAVFIAPNAANDRFKTISLETETTDTSPKVLAVRDNLSQDIDLAQGTWAVVYGENLTKVNSETADSRIPLPTILGGTQVLVNGKAAPILYVSGGQVNFLLPKETPLGSANISVVSAGITSNVVGAPIVSVHPALYPVAIDNESGEYAGGLGFPKITSGEVLQLYGTGLGSVTCDVPSGTPALTDLPCPLSVPVTVMVNGVPAQVLFAGLAPGWIGLYQINIILPNVPADTPFPIMLEVNGFRSASRMMNSK